MFENANLLAHLVAAISTFLVGFLWYNPKTLGTAWMNAAGMTQEKIEGANMGLIFGLAFIFALIATIPIGFVTGLHTEAKDINFLHGAFHGGLFATLIGLPILATNALFERKGLVYILINYGYWLVCFGLMGGILMIWR